MTRNRAELKRRKVAEPQLLLEKVLKDHIEKYIESAVASVKKVLELKEKEVNILKEKYQSLELAKEETDRENLKLKSDNSRTKSCNKCEEKEEKMNAIEEDLNNCKLENERLLQHLFDRKLKTKNYLALLKERDERIEELESQIREQNTEEEEEEETEMRKEEERVGDNDNDRTKEGDPNILNLIDNALLFYSKKTEEQGVDSQMKEKKHSELEEAKSENVSSASYQYKLEPTEDKSKGNLHQERKSRRNRS